MRHVQDTRTINAPIAPTWAAISDLAAVQEWHPNVAHATILTPNATGLGAARRVEFHDGNTLVETVTEESEQDFTTVEMTGSSMLKEAYVTIRTEERSAGTTQVTFSIDYDLKYGPVGRLLDAMMIRRVFGNAIGMALDGLSHHLETDELVNDSIPGEVAA